MNTIFGGTDKGLVRATNQDRFECGSISPQLFYAVLCDGMGGENGGNVASEIATRFAADMLRRDLSEEQSENSLRAVIQSAMSGANALVYDAARKDPGLAGMGTTLILAVACRSRLLIGYVGDSRVYLVTEGEEKQLTKDHTVVQMLVDIGEISEEDAQSHPKRHYITRAVGVSPILEADLIEMDLPDSCWVLLCSDGLYHYLEPGRLRGLLAECTGARSVEPLIRLAKEGGGTDNITAVVIAREPGQ